jgi:hypothetical protein
MLGSRTAESRPKNRDAEITVIDDLIVQHGLRRAGQVGNRVGFPFDQMNPRAERLTDLRIPRSIALVSASRSSATSLGEINRQRNTTTFFDMMRCPRQSGAVGCRARCDPV